jgi:DNA replication and repair protein RecF
LGERFNLVYGLNGTGKTNLLDSVYYLAVGKSYFTPFDHKVVRQGESFFRLEGSVAKDGSHALIIKVVPGDIKEIILNGMPREKIGEHLGFIPVVISAPRDIELVTGSGQSRRKYIDHLLCQLDPIYLQALQTYNYLLNLRNAALKQNVSDLPRLVDTYNVQMAKYADYIFAKRKWMQEEMVAMLETTYRRLAENREEISIAYSSSMHEHSFEVLADMHWESDKSTGRTQAGIHRDDFVLQINGMSARDYGSQGQIKSLIFAMHLSKYDLLLRTTGYKPVLILDDIFDKLDERRLNMLMETLSDDVFGQILLSDTSRSRVGNYISSPLLHEIAMPKT